MKYFTVFVYCLLCLNSLHGQKMPKDYFEEGVQSLRNEKPEAAIPAFAHIVEHHSGNELYPKAFFNLALAYYATEKLDSAKILFKAVINSDFNEKAPSGGDIMSNPNTNYRHRSSNYLLNIYYKKGQYDTALYYLAQSDTAYEYNHFCGNAHAAKNINQALWYAKIYKKQGKLKKAEKMLLKEVFTRLTNNSAIIKALKQLYEKHYNNKPLSKVLDKSISNIYQKTTTNSNGTEYTNYYIKFHGVEIQAPPVDYYSEETGKDEVVKQIKNSNFYKMVKGL